MRPQSREKFRIDGSNPSTPDIRPAVHRSHSTSQQKLTGGSRGLAEEQPLPEWSEDGASSVPDETEPAGAYSLSELSLLPLAWGSAEILFQVAATHRA